MNNRAKPPDADSTDIAREVYRRMVDAGLTQKSLALLAGLSGTYVRDLLRGRSRNPKSDQLGRLAEALGCSPIDLLDPRRASREPSGSYGLDDGDQILSLSPDERALLRMWRVLKLPSKRLVLAAIADMVPRATTGSGRKSDNG